MEEGHFKEKIDKKGNTAMKLIRSPWKHYLYHTRGPFDEIVKEAEGRHCAIYTA